MSQRFALIVAFLIGCGLGVPSALAQQSAYPARALRLILPFPPGGSTARTLAATEMRERLGTMGIQPLASTPEQFGELLKSEVAKWGKAVRESGARVE